MTWDKESVYDNEIAPLMEQIIEICHRSEIPLVAQFQYAGGKDADEASLCSTVITKFPHACADIVRLGVRVAQAARGPEVLAITETTRADGSKDIKIRKVN